MNTEELKTARKLQATLTMIHVGTPCFFNVAEFLGKGLVKEFGKTSDNKTKWILTEKGKRLLTVVV